ncbi:Spindle pole body component like protein [Verticillium longisporum]|uniref:Spindle pole body component like protein n=1 Tax=Verticillium longisporum TaxID=100787 RepID=A0A8I2ZM28_VERLO|nr:Spindle pole body component like protein [Verticillium longisporum]
MARPGYGGVLDTPGTNVGDATYLDRQPDFDMSQEVSFQSPAKDKNIFQQLRHGRPSLRTPRGRGPLADRRNLPLQGAEFTPMLKSATRNSARRAAFGKENGAVPATPAALDRIEEDLTPIPNADASMYSRNASYVDNTLPQVDTSSANSTPLVPLPRRGDGKGPLQDGNQLSLREQENVIDRIEKENFGLKLKIHFLEEALRKAGPGFSEAALKENTELKVDKVTMQRDLQKYKKHLTTAEKDLESYRQQMLQLQEKAKKKYADEKQLAEIDRLQQSLEEKESDLEYLQRQVQQEKGDSAEVEKLRDEIGDLEADLREKDRLIGEHEDQVDDLQAKLNEKDEVLGEREDEIEDYKARLKRAETNAAGEHDEQLRDLETKLQETEAQFKHAQRRMIEMEQEAETQSRQALRRITELEQKAEDEAKQAQRRILELEQKAEAGSSANDELEDARDTIQDLEASIRRLEAQVDEIQDKADDAISDKKRAESDLQELQDEMANKSVVTKGFSRQKEERLTRLQKELEQADERYATLEKEFSQAMTENRSLKSSIQETRQSKDLSEQEHHSLVAKVEELRKELQARIDEKSLLQTRHDALTSESASLQRDVSRLQRSVDELEENLSQERDHALGIETHIRNQFKGDIDRLNDEISDLQAEIRERDNLYDNDSEKWETDRRTLQSERDRAQEKASSLESTIARLREAEGNLSGKEAQLQEALRSEAERHKNEQASLNRQISDLRQDLDSRQSMLTELRNELSATRDELRQTQVDYQSQSEKIESLEDEVEVLQTTLDEESEHSREELEAARRECEDLKQQLESLRRTADLARGTASSYQQNETRASASLERLQTQLDDSTAQVVKLGKEKKDLQDRLASLDLEMRSLRNSLAEARAERDEVESEMKRLQHSGEETLRVDRERLDLRTAKMKLDNEVRRLKEENNVLMEQRRSLERSLEDEIDKSAEEEERLNQEILQLQSKLREASSSDGPESSSTRRTIRELERRIRDYEDQLAATTNVPVGNVTEGNSELSLIADLERQAHEAEMSRLIASPNSSSTSARPSEVNSLRTQLSSAQQSVQEFKTKARDAERKIGQIERDFQSRLDDLEDQKASLEQALEDAQRDADEVTVLHEKALRRLSQKLEKSERERKAAASSRLNLDSMSSEHRNLQELLQQSEAETDALEHDVLQQQDAIDALSAAEASLRRKLERTRSERAAYRLTAEKLQRDIRELKAAADTAPQGHAVYDTLNESAIDTVIRAAEGAEERHGKELRGMALQMEWMQARWEREVSMRADAAYAKKFLQLELEVAHTCNKAQLRELEQIRTEVLGSRRALAAPPPSLAGRLARPPGSRPTFKAVATMARFVARAKICAREWARHEATRKKLADRVEEMRRMKKRRGLKVVREEEEHAV